MYPFNPLSQNKFRLPRTSCSLCDYLLVNAPISTGSSVTAKATFRKTSAPMFDDNDLNRIRDENARDVVQRLCPKKASSGCCKLCRNRLSCNAKVGVLRCSPFQLAELGEDVVLGAYRVTLQEAWICRLESEVKEIEFGWK